MEKDKKGGRRKNKMTTIEEYEIPVEESKGLLDIEQEYTFQLTSLELREGVIFSKDAPEEFRGSLLSELKPEEQKEISKKWYADMVELKWKTVEEGLDVELKESFWVNRITLNENNPEYQSRLGTFIQRMGNVLTPKTTIKLPDYFKVGMQIKAHPEEQKDKQGKGTGYHQLNLGTIKFAGVAPQSYQKPIGMEITKEMQGKVLGVIEGATTKEEAMQMLLANKKGSLMGAFIEMERNGDITFGEEKQ